jgi:hypothetical protein
LITWRVSFVEQLIGTSFSNEGEGGTDEGEGGTDEGEGGTGLELVFVYS